MIASPGRYVAGTATSARGRSCSSERPRKSGTDESDLRRSAIIVLSYPRRPRKHDIRGRRKAVEGYPYCLPLSPLPGQLPSELSFGCLLAAAALRENLR